MTYVRPRPRFLVFAGELYVPYISCSSIVSTSSSLSELSLSDEDDGLKGSGLYAESGIVLDRRPKGRWVLIFLVGSRRREGRSAALRIVGLALSISDMVMFWEVDVPESMVYR